MIRGLLIAVVPLLVVAVASPARAQSEWVYDDSAEKEQEEKEKKKKEREQKKKKKEKEEKKKQEEIKAAEAEPAAAETETKTEEQPADEEEDLIDPDQRSPIDGVKGHIGIGYFTDFAPLGMRMWFTRDWALDVGLDGSFSSGNLDGYQLGIDVGGVYAIAHYHYAVALTRLGVGYRVNGTTGKSGVGARHDIIINAFLGVELFLGAFGFPNVSLQGGYGVQAAWAIEGGTNFVIGASTPSLNVVSSGVVGFHIYL